jgi:hypothetical protein
MSSGAQSRCLTPHQFSYRPSWTPASLRWLDLKGEHEQRGWYLKTIDWTVILLAKPVLKMLTSFHRQGIWAG